MDLQKYNHKNRYLFQFLISIFRFTHKGVFQKSHHIIKEMRLSSRLPYIHKRPYKGNNNNNKLQHKRKLTERSKL